MRWAPIHPRQLLAVVAATVAFMLLLMAAAAPDLGTLDFSLGGGSGAAPAPVEAAPPAGDTARPDWVSDPLAPPLHGLR